MIIKDGQSVLVEVHNGTASRFEVSLNYEGKNGPRGTVLLEKIHVHISEPPRSFEYRTLGPTVDYLELSVRTANCLERAGIRTIEALSRKTEKQLLAIPGFVQKNVDDVQEELRRLNLRLAVKQERKKR